MGQGPMWAHACQGRGLHCPLGPPPPAPSLKTPLAQPPRVKGQWEPQAQRPSAGGGFSGPHYRGPPGKPCPAKAKGPAGPALGPCKGSPRSGGTGHELSEASDGTLGSAEAVKHF